MTFRNALDREQERWFHHAPTWTDEEVGSILDRLRAALASQSTPAPLDVEGRVALVQDAVSFAILAVSGAPCAEQDAHERDIRYAFGPDSQFARAYAQQDTPKPTGEPR